MSAMASQITSLTIVYLNIYSGADQRKHQCSVSLVFVRGTHRWPVNSPHKGPVTRKMFPFDDVIMSITLRLMEWNQPKIYSICPIPIQYCNSTGPLCHAYKDAICWASLKWHGLVITSEIFLYSNRQTCKWWQSMFIWYSLWLNDAI